jgi:flagellin
MSGIVLSASVRQNLLSLQSTAALLATTQNDLATGNKVNSALDNPTNFFTAAGLNNRASDIGNLLDSIGNGVQVLQAANTGITSLQSLVSSAQSIANQVLQTPVGYSTKSNLTSAAITGATANNLLGTGSVGTSGTVTAGTFTTLNVSGTATAATHAKITGTTDLTSFSGTAGTVTINGTSVTINASDTLADVVTDINGTSGVGVTASVSSNGKNLILTSTGTAGSADTITTAGFATAGLGADIDSASGATGSAAVAAASDTFTVTVDGGSAHTVTLSAATVATYNTANSTSLSAASLSAANVASIINSQVGSSVASVVGGALTFTSGTTGASSSIATSAVTAAGTASGSTGVVAASNTGTAAAASLQGETLTIGATGGGTATNITFGTGTNQISTLNALNTALAANNLQATIDSATGEINIVTSNDAASSTIGTIGGTAVSTANAAFSASSSAAPVVDPNSQATRASLVAQYNNVLQQINTTSQDSSFNGINLLNGDTLKLVFNETGTSTLAITGVTFNGAGLGLSNLNANTDFLDNNSANSVLTQLQNASTSLRTEASALGSNLSVVQIRQDFNKNLIDVLQTGASNLTLADPNQEAADSQALSTRQSIAVSALALANQSQQSVLQLLR